MKKLVSIILMVLMLTGISAATADIIHDGVMYGIDYDYANKIMKEYAELKEYTDHLNGNDVNGVLYSLGGLCVEDFMHQSEMNWSINNFNIWSAKDFNMVEIHTYEIELFHGITMYRTQAQSETKPLGYKNGNAYYCADVIFMVFSLNNFYE